jgi:hypothetical protein
MLESTGTPDAPTPARWSELRRLAGNHELADLVFNSFWSGTLLPSDLPEAVADAWTMESAPEGRLHTDEWLELFDAAGFVSDTPSTFAPTEPLRLYRGSSPARVTRMSWTSSPDVASAFAARHTAAGFAATVFQATVPPENVLGFFNSRSESEFVINTDGIRFSELT